MNYIDAVIYFCEQNNIDVESVPKLISKQKYTSDSKTNSFVGLDGADSYYDNFNEYYENIFTWHSNALAQDEKSGFSKSLC